MGIIAIFLGVIALVVSWIPFLSAVSIPLSLIALLLAGAGIAIALIKRKRFAVPIVGGTLAIFSIIITTALNSPTVAESDDDLLGKMADRINRELTAAAQVEISDVIFQVDDFTNTYIVGYSLTNNSLENLRTVKTLVSFQSEDGHVVWQETETPVNLRSPIWLPGQKTFVSPTSSRYSSFPCEQGTTVVIEVESVSID